jgi:photosystem I P700 chlorophyll a apoprotein A1
MYFHGARISNCEACLDDATQIQPSAHVVWPRVRQQILNGNAGGGFNGIQIISYLFFLDYAEKSQPIPDSKRLSQTS